MYQFTKLDRDDPHLRSSFNALAEETFDLNFEGWYQNGFWGDQYQPYSMLYDGQVVANVSLNRTDLLIDGQKRTVFQLGTVMTAPAHRNRGLFRAIMAQIDIDTAGADGVYLFGNDNVLEFYPKFGFTKGREFIFHRSVQQRTPRDLKQIPMNSPANWVLLRTAMEENMFSTGCCMTDNPGLIFFYVSQFMQDSVFVHSPTNTWIIADQEGEELFIHNVFTKADVSLEQIIQAFGPDVKQVTLGFTPTDPSGWEVQEFHEEDCTFFVKGSLFKEFEARRLRIPSLSHA